jgi:4-carboxymuconolactone decarboxylase
MARIPLPTAATMTPEQQRVHDFVKGRSRDDHVGAPYQVALHAPEFLERWQQVGETLRYYNSLPPAFSEMAILVTARHTSCQYEWIAHEPHARKGGLPDAVIEAIRQGRRPAFDDPAAAAVYDFVREAHEQHFVSDAAYRQVLDRFGVKGTVELTALIGHYAMIAMMINVHEYGTDGLAPPLPPLGGEHAR